MLTNDTISKLHALKLFGMAAGFDRQLSGSATSSLSFEERFGLLVDEEVAFRDNRRLQRLLKAAKLREPSACIEDIRYFPDRGLDRAFVASLAIGSWITHRKNLLMTGATGSGKSWMACALGHQACRLGFAVHFRRVSLLLEELQISHADGTFLQKLERLGKWDLLILDDFGTGTISPVGRNDLLEVIERRSGLHSTLITSQLPVESWHAYLGETNPTQADATMDRLVSGAERMLMKCKKSMRNRTE